MITCDKCGEPKDNKRFYFDYNNKDTGRKATCVICYNKVKKKNILDTKKDKRRSQDAKKVNLILYKKRKGTGLSEKIYNGSINPTFLQFNHLIYKHIEKEYEFTFDEFNMLLLLYPILPFTKDEYHACRKLNEYKNTSFINKLIKEGWIFKWKRDMYDFTDKCKKLIKNSHVWALGKKPIPDTISIDVMSIFRKIQRRKR